MTLVAKSSSGFIVADFAFYVVLCRVGGFGDVTECLVRVQWIVDVRAVVGRVT